jgi:hypothetical protein
MAAASGWVWPLTGLGATNTVLEKASRTISELIAGRREDFSMIRDNAHRISLFIFFQDKQHGAPATIGPTTETTIMLTKTICFNRKGGRAAFKAVRAF